MLSTIFITKLVTVISITAWFSFFKKFYAVTVFWGLAFVCAIITLTGNVYELVFWVTVFTVSTLVVVFFGEES